MPQTEPTKVSLEELSRSITESIISQLKPKFEEYDKKIELLANSVDESATVHHHTETPSGLLHYGRMQIVDRGDTEDITCPECGRTHLGVAKPVKEVVKTVEKVKVPKDYVKVPETWNEFQEFLNMPHPDGHSLLDCPNCAPKFADWLKQHDKDLNKLGLEIKTKR